MKKTGCAVLKSQNHKTPQIINILIREWFTEAIRRRAPEGPTEGWSGPARAHMAWNDRRTPSPIPRGGQRAAEGCEFLKKVIVGAAGYLGAPAK